MHYKDRESPDGEEFLQIRLLNIKSTHTDDSSDAEDDDDISPHSFNGNLNRNIKAMKGKTNSVDLKQSVAESADTDAKNKKKKKRKNKKKKKKAVEEAKSE